MNIDNIINYTGEVDPTLLIPKIGKSYKEINKLSEIVDLLEQWQYKSALIKLDNLIQNESELLNALLLKGELLAHFDLNQDAADVFKQVLQLDQNNIVAEVLLLVQLTILEAETEATHYNNCLSEHSPKLYTAFNHTNDFIEENKNRFDFPGNVETLDLICVYGYSLNNDGSLPAVLDRRLATVTELAIKNPSLTILLSGGAVINKYNEAIEMKKVLIKRGVNEHRILTLEHAKDTVGNVIEFIEYITHRSFKHIGVVTSKAHLPRAWMALSLALENINYQTCLSGISPEETINEQMMTVEHKLNYQTQFRIAGLFEKKDIIALLDKGTI